MLKESLIKECVTVLKREDIKRELKNMVSPLLDVVLDHINPYLYLCLMFVLISFLLHLGIFIMLYKSRGPAAKGATTALINL